MEFHDDDVFKEFDFVAAVRQNKIKPSTAIAFLKELSGEEFHSWTKIFSDTDLDIMEPMLIDLTADYKLKKLNNQNWWLAVGNFITW